jgi:hypothetical protein
MIQIGDLCKVKVRNTHKPCQLGDLVLVTGFLGGSYDPNPNFLVGTNLKTNQRHHYRIVELEVVCSKLET